MVSALRLAGAEALHNVCQHAGVTRAWLTGTSDGDPLRPTVRVAVVDNDKLVPVGLRALLAPADQIELVHAVGSVDEHLSRPVPP